MKCKLCSAEIPEDSATCPKCGAPVENGTTELSNATEEETTVLSDATEEETTVLSDAVEEDTTETSAEGESEAAVQSSESAADAVEDGGYVMDKSDIPAPVLTEEELERAKKTKKRQTVSIVLSCISIVLLLAVLIFIVISLVNDKNGVSNNAEAKQQASFVKSVEKAKNFPFHVYGETIGNYEDKDMDDALVKVTYLYQLNMSAYMSSYYDSQYGYAGYGAMVTGFDYNKLPIEQKAKDADGNTIGYDENLMNTAVEELEKLYYSYSQAQADKFELSDEDVEEFRDMFWKAVEADSQYVYSIFGYTDDSELSEDDIKAVLYQYLYLQTVNEKYSAHVLESLKAEVTDEEAEAEYSENKNDYNVVTMRIFGKQYESLLPEAETEATTSAEGTDSTETTAADNTALTAAVEAYVSELEKTVKDEASFKKAALAASAEITEDTYESATMCNHLAYANVENSLGEEDTQWIFSSDRKAGDVLIINSSDNSYVYAVLIMEPAQRNDECLPNARIIPVTSTSEDESAADTANAILDEFNAGKKTEESFIALVEKNCTDESLVSTGGLLENVDKGMYIESLESWIFDESRKAGDAGVVEMSSGALVVYFCGVNELPSWKATAVDAVAADKLTEKQTADEEAYKGSVEFADGVFDTLLEKLNKYCATVLNKDSEDGTTAAAA